jgi:DNA-binding NtrC family response regulator
MELSRRMFALAPKIKILLMTGSDSVSTEEAGQEGFCGLLQKPFHLAAVLGAIEAVAAGEFFTGLKEPATGF